MPKVSDPSTEIQVRPLRERPEIPKPIWHPPWKLMRIMQGCSVKSWAVGRGWRLFFCFAFEDGFGFLCSQWVLEENTNMGLNDIAVLPFACSFRRFTHILGSHGTVKGRQIGSFGQVFYLGQSEGCWTTSSCTLVISPMNRFKGKSARKPHGLHLQSRNSCSNLRSLKANSRIFDSKVGQS